MSCSGNAGLPSRWLRESELVQVDGPSICSGVSVHTGCASARRPTPRRQCERETAENPTAFACSCFPFDGHAARVTRGPGRFWREPAGALAIMVVRSPLKSENAG